MSLGVAWFRRDLRTHDNPALDAATAAHERVVPLYVLDARLLDAAGPYRRRQVLAHVGALREALDGRLLVREGDPAEVVPHVVEELGADAVHWNADVTPLARARDGAVEDALGERARAWSGQYVHAPGAIVTGEGNVSRMFTPFLKRWEATPWASWPEPGDGELVGPRQLRVPTVRLPHPDHDPPMPAGEQAAGRRLADFLDRVDVAARDRDAPALDGTSHLSADLRFGVLSPRTVVEAAGHATRARAAFVRQVAWRDWYGHLLHAHPRMATDAMNRAMAHLAWRDDDEGFAAWAEGRTGYPFVDAGMRQLRATGWMHNRARLVAGSFLVKDLLVDWRRGERLFRHLLVDGDVPQNVGNWQWVAGTGPDAAPYVRIFNPVTQSRRFDPGGAYLRQWVPELAGLDDDAIHAPWEVGPLVLGAAGVVLGETYPEPIVDHAAARDRALAAYAVASR